jgi:hypothetical protein
VPPYDNDEPNVDTKIGDHHREETELSMSTPADVFHVENESVNKTSDGVEDSRTHTQLTPAEAATYNSVPVIYNDDVDFQSSLSQQSRARRDQNLRRVSRLHALQNTAAIRRIGTQAHLSAAVACKAPD